MATRRERLLESLKKEDRNADLKRLKKAKEYLSLATAVLQKPMHNDREGYVEVASKNIAEQINRINQAILKR